MPNLILDGLHINQYNQKEVCAYIGFLNEEKQFTDHRGNALGDSLQRADSFKRYLKNHVASSINKQCQNSNYYIKLISYENQAPLPVMIVARHDKKNISETELPSIREIFVAALAEVNLSNATAMSHSSLFPTQQQQNSAKIQQEAPHVDSKTFRI